MALSFGNTRVVFQCMLGLDIGEKAFIIIIISSVQFHIATEQHSQRNANSTLSRVRIPACCQRTHYKVPVHREGPMHAVMKANALQ